MKKMAIEIGRSVPTERARGLRIHPEPPRLHVLERDRGQRSGMTSPVIEKERRMEDLEGAVGIEGRVDSSDAREIAIEEFRQASGVVDGASSRTARDEELEFGEGERVLHVHEQEPHGRGIRGSGSEGVPPAKLDGFPSALGVGNAVDLTGSSRIEMLGERQLAHQKTSTTVGVCEANW
jgi:hypothetical protein